MKWPTVPIVSAVALSVSGVLPSSPESTEQRHEIAVNVLDATGNQRLDLTAENFRGKCGDQPVGIVSARVESRPRRLALIVDTSGSMTKYAESSWKAAQDLVSVLTPYNAAMILTLNIRLDQYSGLSSSPEVLRKALRKARDARRHWGPSALSDGVLDVSRECGARWDLADVVAVITDGDDTASATNARDAMRSMAETGIRVCVLWMNDAPQSRPLSEAPSWVRGVAEATGGLVVSPGGRGVERLRSMASALTEVYRLALELPPGIERPKEWELKVVDGDGKELRGVKVVYPHFVNPSSTR